MQNLPSHEASSGVIEIVSSGFNCPFRPRTDGTTIVAIANDNPRSHAIKYNGTEDKNCGNNDNISVIYCDCTIFFLSNYLRQESSKRASLMWS